MNLPLISNRNQVIDGSWEPFLRPCSCGGNFRKGASPRCLRCNSTLSAEYAAGHIERNSVGAAKGWRWQGNWSDTYCMVIEDQSNPGHLRQIADPIIRLSNPNERKVKRLWAQIFSMSR
ncbi:MAG: hypothetical protein WAM85_01185 [Terracidiphilus sp.]